MNVLTVRSDPSPQTAHLLFSCKKCNRLSVGTFCLYCGPAEEEAPTSAKPDEGLRYNEGKPRFDLVPAEAMVALAAHYEAGAKKYADRNWEKGMAWGKCFASLQRHAWAWMGGEDFDPETGTHHMVSVAWNAIALFVYSVRKIGTDDRPKKPT